MDASLQSAIVASHRDTLPSGESESASSQATSRIATLDAVRGFAVFGILLRNVFVFGIPTTAYALPAFWSGDEMLQWASWAFIELFVDGSMRGLFSMLFGATALLLLTRHTADPIGDADRFYRRLIWLMAFGLVHAYLLLSPVDILFVYGCVGLFIFPLRNVSPRNLLIGGGALLLAAAIMSAAVVVLSHEFQRLELASETETTQASQSDGEADASQAQATQAETAGTLSESTDQQAASEDEITEALARTWAGEVMERREDYIYNILSLAETSFENHVPDLFKTHIFDVGALFLIGMALFKLGVLTGARSTRFYLWMLACGYGLGLTVNAFETLPLISQTGADTDDSGDWATITYDLGRVAITFGHLALVVLISRAGIFGAVSRAFEAAGRLALTNYVMQTILFTTLFFGHGFGLYGELTHAQVLATGLTLGIAQLIASVVYLRYFTQGPLEWLIRHLVEWGPEKKPQPM